MPIGRYYAFQRSDELNTSIRFIDLFQVWLAIFAFSATPIPFLLEPLGRLLMQQNSFSYFFAGVVALVIGGLGVIVIYSLYRIAKIFWEGFRGKVIRYDSNTPANVVKAIRPLVDRGDLQEYKKILAKQIEENNKVIADYEHILRQLEVENDNDSKEYPV